MQNATCENPGLRVIYRSTVAGHRNCTAATMALPSTSHPDGVQFLPSQEQPDFFGWSSIDALRPSIDEIFRGIGAAILEVWTPASLRPEMHPAFPDRLSHNIDCLHFCPSEAVYRTWALMLVNTIQEWGLLHRGEGNEEHQHEGAACAAAAGRSPRRPAGHQSPFPINATHRSHGTVA